MKLTLLASAVALGVSFVDTAALADDPHDPLMRDQRARARDHEIIRQLNLAELHKVRARCPNGSAMARLARMAGRPPPIMEPRPVQ